ncbi:MAG: cytochrome D ubiquinol oxidase subunit II, partial [Nitrospinaceae bacterium]|nr:cytochrome D ubiquinol oxidase subunit II [Nitrospinaceae bacterium]NIR55132.1 cytochrome D ubiquinol oxidase subunit II [Nitrospinaceae bacterium]NIS85552.1 cytochrome D ubiquinol oxidase subunit II [Nitrospinaceae bacterium]NIT82386.1 cytochrome D ubiquinol oxidase subunit II [Nitrospinaceae bacterium]NIU44599.1 cytochrome D ubiquinol oxidase subunit II [Nitrospinaceae bacterium]
MANKNYRVGEARAEQLIDELVQMGCSEDCAELYRQILTTVVKLGREHSDTG